MATINVTYQVYAGGRWLSNVINLSDYAGIYGTPIQGVYASLSSGNISYRTHTQGGSWLSWVTNRSDYAGILGRNVDGLQMKVSGLSGYNVRYRAYVSGSWLPWVNGTEDYAGIYGQAISGIQVEIIDIKAAILSQTKDRGIFKGLGITFPAYDVWKTMSVIGLCPYITVEGRVSLQSHMGSSTTLNIGSDSVNLATTVRNQLINCGVSMDGTFTLNNISASLNSITINSDISKYVKVSSTVLGSTIVIELEFNYTTQGTTVYQTVRISIHDYSSYGYVTIPVIVTDSAPSGIHLWEPMDPIIFLGVTMAAMYAIHALLNHLLGKPSFAI
ncbi:MAG: hypothetical protein ACERKV_04135 [Clostridiaceae bacterium]